MSLAIDRIDRLSSGRKRVLAGLALYRCLREEILFTRKPLQLTVAFKNFRRRRLVPASQSRNSIAPCLGSPRRGVPRFRVRCGSATSSAANPSADRPPAHTMEVLLAKCCQRRGMYVVTTSSASSSERAPLFAAGVSFSWVFCRVHRMHRRASPCIARQRGDILSSPDRFTSPFLLVGEHVRHSRPLYRALYFRGSRRRAEKWRESAPC